MNQEIQINLPIQTTGDMRMIRIYLPKDYEHTKINYPVLYMHDGQNLFHDDLSYGGYAWDVMGAVYKTDTKVIVVGIDNSPSRHLEYVPFITKNYDKQFPFDHVGGLGDQYAEFVIKTVIPYIDQMYRTNPNKRYIAGSSLGAYISLYMIATYPDIFIGAGIFSLASWFNEKDLLDVVRKSRLSDHHVFYVSVGRNEYGNHDDVKNKAYVENTKNVLQTLKEKGVHQLIYVESDDTHHELAWRKRIPEFLESIKKQGV